jgi:hypothetical protein
MRNRQEIEEEILLNISTMSSIMVESHTLRTQLIIVELLLDMREQNKMIIELLKHSGM